MRTVSSDTPGRTGITYHIRFRNRRLRTVEKVRKTVDSLVYVCIVERVSCLSSNRPDPPVFVSTTGTSCLKAVKVMGNFSSNRF